MFTFDLAWGETRMLINRKGKKVTYTGVFWRSVRSKTRDLSVTLLARHAYGWTALWGHFFGQNLMFTKISTHWRRRMITFWTRHLGSVYTIHTFYTKCDKCSQDLSSKNIEIIHQNMFEIKINGSFFFNIINKTVSSFFCLPQVMEFTRKICLKHTIKNRKSIIIRSVIIIFY